MKSQANLKAMHESIASYNKTLQETELVCASYVTALNSFRFASCSY